MEAGSDGGSKMCLGGAKEIGQIKIWISSCTVK